MPYEIMTRGRAAKASVADPGPGGIIAAIILALVLLFLGGRAVADTVQAIGDEIPKLDDKAKLCHAEFAMKKCDPVLPDRECDKLMQCIRGG
jgi:hypothetical protein